jgi:sensor domain CHASE-containing protein
MIDDIGGAIFVGLVLAVILSFIWALSEAAQRKDLEQRLKDVSREHRRLRKENKKLEARVSAYDKYWRMKR